MRPDNCIDELVRCVDEYGFVGCNLDPDPSGGHCREPPLTDRWWYPLYEKLVELDVPATVHVSASRDAAFHTTGAHYLTRRYDRVHAVPHIASARRLPDASRYGCIGLVSRP